MRQTRLPLLSSTARGRIVTGSRLKKAVKKISPHKKPDDLSLDDWQIALRREIAKDQRIRVRNVGQHPIFSEFDVKNPKTQKIYRVVIRGLATGVNYCSCPDFAVNTLGTCKHIERVLEKLLRQKNARQALQEGHISTHSSVTLRYGSLRRVAFCLGRNASDGLRALAKKFFDAEGFLSVDGFQKFDAFVKAAKELKDDVRYHQDAMEFIAQVRDEAMRKHRIARLLPQGEQGPQWKELLKTTLFAYQKKGALFAANAGRCVIADEMGLGKTVQAIAASEILAKAMGVEKVLILCPTSLKFQWKQEIERFTERSAKIICGMWHHRQSQYGAEGFFKIAGYDVVFRDAQAIAAWAPDLIILDEAQRIKNWKTRTAKSVKRLSSPYAIVLTGTPLENRLEELHSIVEFVDRYRLGPLFRFLNRHQITDDSGKVTGYRELHSVGNTLQPILIRRAKKEVATQLPERMDKHYFVPMTKPQWDIHDENKETVAKLVAKWKKFHFLSEQDQRKLMICLQNMRMACDSTYLLDEKTMHGKKVDELEVQLREIFETPAAKVVIFTQWLRMAELVAAMLNVNGWKYAQLHGGVPGNKRGELIQQFMEKPECRVFLSTDAGGVGLNLQHATTVVNLDMPWNPAVLEQRIGRVHRLGQTQPVRVLHFVSEGTIEHGMLTLHRFKRSMFSGILDGGDNEVFMGESRLTRFMKTVETATGAVPQSSPIAQENDTENEDKEVAGDEDVRDEEVERNETSKDAPGTSRSSPNSQGASLKSLLQAGASFLANLSETLDGKKDTSQIISRLKSTLPIKVKTNASTGQSALEIPLPDEKTMAVLTQAAGLVFDFLKKQSAVGGNGKSH